ncbi:unnamed protein product [Owenia fusiformis]|uniref:UDP-glucuronosyltransferase n=1 Tax=Owenia fusiformis TaxID=6347 RepID=A0A8J1TWN4_OWEFU|nr:unnamed protein product [Owenia fusiformis]
MKIEMAWRQTFMVLIWTFIGLKNIGGYKILMYPYGIGVTSRVTNMEKMCNILAENGHDVSMVISNRYDESKRSIDKRVTVHKFQIPAETRLNSDVDVLRIFMDGTPSEAGEIFFKLQFSFCDSLLKSGLMERLKTMDFNLFIADQADMCSVLLLDYLDIPVIYYENGDVYNDSPLGGGLGHPTPWSFIPNLMSADLSDNMRFAERVQNVFLHLLMQMFRLKALSTAQELRDSYGYNKTVDIRNSARDRVALIFSNSHISIDYPRPRMPNHIYIGGLSILPPQPLPNHIATIMEQASEVIVVSFGSSFNELVIEKKKNVLLDVFATLPQTIVWRFDGKIPGNIPKNVHVFPWLPQSDLLGHPKTRVFVTHCGQSSTLEAIYHGVPVVAIPLAADQPYHATQLTTRANMGVRIDKNFTADDLGNAIRKVIGNETYAKNARKMSNQFRDNPISPKETFQYWVNYVIRHKGAPHLKSQGLNQLNIAQYFLLDIMAALLLLIVSLIFMVYFMCRCTLRKCKSKCQHAKKD